MIDRLVIATGALVPIVYVFWDVALHPAVAAVYVLGALALRGRDDTILAIVAVAFAIVAPGLGMYTATPEPFARVAFAIASTLLAVLASRNDARFRALSWLGAFLGVASLGGFDGVWTVARIGVAVSLLAIWIRSVARC